LAQQLLTKTGRGRTGLLEQAFLTTVNRSAGSPIANNIVRNGEIKLNEDESYQLKVEPNKIAINAYNRTLHGLETLYLQNNSTLYYFLLRSFQIPTVYLESY
jgi:hexosaminidase